jgi:hypothetical protein
MPTLEGTIFLQTFFCADGKHPNPNESLEHFLQAFEEPLYFKNLCKHIEPDAGGCKVVILDGHPRTGKTWAAAKAIDNFITSYGLTEDEWMTTGFDSLAVFSNSDDLLPACQEVEELINQRSQSLKVIFLDDFLGTNMPRDLASTIDNNDVKKYFLWNKCNPWLKNLSKASVLIMTGRSSFFALAEMLWDIELRQNLQVTIEPDNYITVINPRSGIFRNLYEGEIFGAFDRFSLKNAVEKNFLYHPLRDNKDWMIKNAPLVAFDQDAVDPVNKQIDASAKDTAAGVLFEDDINVFSKYAELALTTDTFSGVRNKILIAYLVTIAPGLLFIGDRAYNALGVNKEEAASIIKKLYWYENIEKFKSGKIPNEFFMTAVRTNLRENLPLVTRVFLEIVDHDLSRSAAGKRGLMERALYEAANYIRYNRESGFSDTSSETVVKMFPIELFDEFNYPNWMQAHEAFSDAYVNFMISDGITPGIAASLGFAIYQFFSCDISSTVVKNIKNYIGEQLSASFQQPPTYLDHTIACYSSYLQWALRIESCPEDGGLVDELMRIYKDVDLQFEDKKNRNKMRMVLEDELFWAAQYWSSKHEKHDFSKLDSVKNLLTDTIADIQKTLKAGKLSPDDSHNDSLWLNVNRYFTFVWHNEWMDKTDKESIELSSDISIKIEDLRTWVNIIRDSITDIISSKPNILDSNLRYHWCHFITQYSVWMRNWTFSLDPHDEERNRVTAGSLHSKNNGYFVDLATTLINNITFRDEDIEGKRLRNIFFCIASRASRISTTSSNHLGNLLSLTDLAWNTSKKEDSHLLSDHIMHAIYELCRHGYLEPHYNNCSYLLSEWCMEKQNGCDHDSELWDRYLEEIKKFTHPLDLIPKRWDDVRPDNWEN